jgi:carbonic anhydrase
MESPHRLLPALLALAVAGAATAQRSPDDALRALQEGNQRFASDRSVAQPLGEGVRRTLARGQSPFAVVLTCADSQVPPEHLFNAGLGELHVVRVGAHVADAETVASIEYAVEHLNVQLCVVLAHENCSAIATGLQQIGSESATAPSPAMQHLLESIEPAVRKVRTRDLGGSALQTACEEEHAHAMVHSCLRRSPLLRRYAQVGRFRIVPARLHQQSGEVEWLPPRPLPAEPSEPLPTPAASVPMAAPPHVALRLLQAGHRRFLSDSKPAADLGSKRREQLVHGQQPLAIVLCCDDSRTVPEHVFDQGLGELFVVRLSGNTLSDSALATIEYAAGQLGASLLVVMGHTGCAAIAAAAEHPAGQNLSPNQRALLLRLEPSIEAARQQGKGRSLTDLAMRGHVLRTAQEARSRSALLRQLEQAGRFAVLGTVYDTASGDLEWLKDQADAEVAGHGAAAHGKPVAKSVAVKAKAGHGDDGHGDNHGNDTKSSHGHDDHAPKGGHDTAAHGKPAAKAGHGAVGSHDTLPVMEWAAEAAPHGETRQPQADAHGAAGHDPQHGAAEHGAHATGHGDDHGTAAHGDGHGDAHADPHADAHGGKHDQDAHGAAGHGDHATDSGAHGDDHAHPHGAEAAHPTAGKAGELTWKDPVVIVGIAGVVSLLLAAVLAMKR